MTNEDLMRAIEYVHLAKDVHRRIQLVRSMQEKENTVVNLAKAHSLLGEIYDRIEHTRENSYVRVDLACLYLLLRGNVVTEMAYADRRLVA